jgi:predicted SAM-dependent methyltransferase
LLRNSRLKKYLQEGKCKIYFGCGNVRQEGYINIDVRWTPAVDIMAKLEWCSRKFHGKCHEVYISHLLEHFNSPGKAMRDSSKTVLGALNLINTMLVPDGKIRIAVPDFRALAELYVKEDFPLFPRLHGRLMGEQNYPENQHACAFDRDFLEFCLKRCNYGDVQEWIPEDEGFSPDGSFDRVNGRVTSLNLLARKVEQI